MTSSRLEAFSDGVIAILITILVLTLHIPQGMSWRDLSPLLPDFLSYVLSFIYLAIYWNNHHHMLKLTRQVSGAILWANMHLLFWLSLIPFTTGWMGQNHFAPQPTALYGIVLLMAALAWQLLQLAIVRHQGPGSTLAKALGSDMKGKLSLLLYLAGVASAFYQPWIAMALYVIVALMWLIPDRRFESTIAA